MIKRAILGMACAVSMSAAAQAEWMEASSQHFLVYGDMNEGQARQWTERLERLDHFLRGATGMQEDPGTSGRVTVYVVPSMSTVQQLGGNSNLGGFYAAHAQGSLAVTPRSIDPRYLIKPQQILFHEYTHHILLSSTAAIYPGWVHEAFAEFFSTAYSDDDGSLVIGAPPLDRGYSLMKQYRMTARELLTSGERKLSEDENLQMYARGWLLVHYLIMNKERAGQLGKYLSLVERNVPSLDAGKQAFGDLGKLDQEIGAYFRSGRFPIAKIPAREIAVGPIKVRQLRSCEARIMPIRIRSATGVSEKTAGPVAAAARTAAAGCENDPFVQRTLAETEFDAKNNDASIAAADRALAADPQNMMALVYKGRVFARQKNVVEARKWFVKANRLDPNFALPLVLYYDSFIRADEKPSENALNGLLRAGALVPQDASLRIRVVRALLASGDVEGARNVLAPLAFAPHQGPDSAARKIYNLMKGNSDVKALLDAADKEKWNEVGNE